MSEIQIFMAATLNHLMLIEQLLASGRVEAGATELKALRKTVSETCGMFAGKVCPICSTSGIARTETNGSVSFVCPRHGGIQ